MTIFVAFSRTIALLALAVWPALTFGQIERPMTFSVFWPCMGNASFCSPRILATGVIERNSHSKLSAFLSDPARAKDFLPQKPDICFNSPGGNLQGGLDLGRLIRRRGLSTCLESDYARVVKGFDEPQVFVTNVVCASSCAFAMLGGVNRFFDMSEDDRVYGVHQFYSSNGSIGDSATQVTVVLLAQYLENMGISRALLDTASLVPPNEIYWLRPQQLVEYEIDNMTTINSPWALNALDDGTVVASVSQNKAGAQSRVTLSILKSQGQPTVVVSFTPSTRFSNRLEDALDAVNGNEITLLVDGRRIAQYESVNWQVINDSVVARLSITDRTVDRLRRGRVLDLKVFVPGMLGQHDPTMSFSLDRIGPMLAAAMK